MQEGRGTALKASVRTRIRVAATAIAVVAVDQASKAIALKELSDTHRVPLIGRWLGLRLVRNPGAAFGVVPGSTFFIFIVSIAIMLIVGRWAWTNPKAPIAIGVVLGGGAGNLIDRIFQFPGAGKGYVVDFIDLAFWPTFNLADTAIVIGAALLIIGGWKSKRN